MKIQSLIISSLLLNTAPLAANATPIINPLAYSSINFDGSWDVGMGEIDEALSGLDSLGDVHLTLLNGFEGETESWFGTGTSTVILEEISGYSGKTTFGWYNTLVPTSFGQLFSGADSAGAMASAVFGSSISFGFYIDPNGIQSNRLYTQHLLNPAHSYQTSIWGIDELPGQFVLGWEDLRLNGSSDGDYQDLIVRFSVLNPSVARAMAVDVPEPGTLMLMVLGVAGLSLARKGKVLTP